MTQRDETTETVGIYLTEDERKLLSELLSKLHQDRLERVVIPFDDERKGYVNTVTLKGGEIPLPDQITPEQIAEHCNRMICSFWDWPGNPYSNGELVYRVALGALRRMRDLARTGINVADADFPAVQAICQRITALSLMPAVPVRVAQVERDELRAASDEPQCQGCGEAWDTHGLICAASTGKWPGNESDEQVFAALRSESEVKTNSTLTRGPAIDRAKLYTAAWETHEEHVRNQWFNAQRIVFAVVDRVLEELTGLGDDERADLRLVREATNLELQRVPAGPQHNWERDKLASCLDTLDKLIGDEA